MRPSWTRRSTRPSPEGGKISREVGGKFNTFDDYASGVNLELVPDEKIVQSWRASDWAEGQYSQATFALAKVAAGRA